MKYLTLCYLMLLPFIIGAQNIAPKTQLTKNFQSAEERIVYNKKQQRPNKYEGVLIQYSYLLKEDAYPLGENGVKNLVEEKFEGINSIEFRKSGDQVYLDILTDGHRENHRQYDDLLYLHTQYLGRSNRAYLLK